MAKKLKPFYNIGPGQIIKREMEELNWNQEDLAEILGMSAKSISQIINNKQAITVDTAKLLGKAFNTSPEFWLNLEQKYRLRLKSEGKKESDTETKAQIRKHLPILQMRKKGWITCDKTAKSQVKAYCKFWGIDELDFSMYNPDLIPFCARKGNNDSDYTLYYSQTWLRKAHLESKKLTSQPYNKTQLKLLINRVKEYTVKENGIKNFLMELKKCGIKFLVLSHLEKTYLDGASFINLNNPVIVYTGRHNRIDNFWWTITHEIAHVLLHLHSDKDCFIDNLDSIDDSNKKEIEADQFVRKILNVDKIIDDTNPYKNYFSEQRLLAISDKYGIHPSVLVGILQFNKLVSYRSLNQYKKNIMDKIPESYIKG
ncbi:MAG: HigA family addiction module antitoxin [Spirochaetes bacterium]|nr:HigA family addiction module antitoxin [Spirochaetota bacterium]